MPPDDDVRLRLLIDAAATVRGDLPALLALIPPARLRWLNQGQRSTTSSSLGIRSRTRRSRSWSGFQSARTTRQARPNVSVPTQRASGHVLEILVDSHERYPWRFSTQQATASRRALPAGDYAIAADGRIIASVERKSLQDLVGTLTGGKLRYLLAALSEVALVVEDRYSAVFKMGRVRPAVVAGGLAEAQVRFPGGPIVFCETRPLAQEWAYRFLGAALEHHLSDEPAAELNAQTASGSDRSARFKASYSATEISPWASLPSSSSRGDGETADRRVRVAATIAQATTPHKASIIRPITNQPPEPQLPFQFIIAVPPNVVATSAWLQSAPAQRTPPRAKGHRRATGPGLRRCGSVLSGRCRARTRSETVSGRPGAGSLRAGGSGIRSSSIS